MCAGQTGGVPHVGYTWSEAQQRELHWKSSPLKAGKISREGMDWIKKKSYPRSLFLRKYRIQASGEDS